MGRKVTDVYLDGLQKWYDQHKYANNKCKCNYKFLEQYFREELACKKKVAFDWIVELTELYQYKFDGNYISFDAPRKP